MKRIFAPIWKAWFFINFAITFIILYPFFFITIKLQWLNLTFKIKRVWSFCIAYFSGVIPTLIYESKSKKMPKPSVFVGNHTSYLDIVLSTFYIDHLALYMGKAELLKAPLFKTFFKGMDIAVNRKSIKDSHRAFTRAGEEIDKGRSMVIYPEGTISSNGVLKAFKNGPFKLAIEKQVPIVPVVNLNNWELLQNGGFFKSNGRPGIAKTVILEPIETKGLTEENLVDLRDKVYHLINDTLTKYNGTKN
ncbi:MAG: 1-acyl-sn-glycerol-3-phosphate acyltransferase [Bacteroidia bacterium]|nr:1-acyl-sn-glycerol-3-phosphate acyltransferase [Bacteroidia bacterium]